MIDTVTELRAALDAERAAGRAVGLVPTMGALHEGHLSLVRRAVAECDVVCATVFVNPLQFGPHEDFDAYPRDLDTDAALAAGAGAALLFAPLTAEMFPAEPCTTVHVAGVSEGMEGASRPGHFDGVATIVTKLFAIAGPCRAYFGEKDFQQLAVVRQLVRDLSLPVDVVGCPTVRDVDGLALSSRNAYLTAEQRQSALVLHRALCAGAAAVAAGETDPATVAELMASIVAAEPEVQLDYAEAVDPRTLRRPAALDGEVRLLVAARVGTTRLIDNLGARTPGAAPNHDHHHPEQGATVPAARTDHQESH